MKRKPIPIQKEVLIQSVGAEGKAVAKVDGLVIFVPYVVPGDIVDIQIVFRKKNYLEGKAIHFHKYSELRTEPFCRHFGTCGGCSWQNIIYEKQLDFKNNIVQDHLQRIGGINIENILPIEPSEETMYYRNKLEFTFSPLAWLSEEDMDNEEKQNIQALGFHIPRRFDRILDIDKCYLQNDLSNDVRNTVKKIALDNNFSFYNVRSKEGLLRNIILRNNHDGDFMVILVLSEYVENAIDTIFNRLKTDFSSIKSFYYVINSKLNDSIQDLQPELWGGDEFLIEHLDSPVNTNKKLSFQIAPLSFFQTNVLQTQKLYKTAFDLADLKGSETVYDLYCGTGTISIYMAQVAKKVVGIEYVDMAIDDAKINAKINNLDNISFYAGDIAKVLNDDFVKTNGKPDVIITDPPRAGMHEKVVKQLLNIEAEKIVYVSCNSATQARDVKLLSEKYTPVISKAFDMFPHTHHTENVILLKKKNS